MKKRVLSLFLAITLCLTLTPTGALAEESLPEQTVVATQETETPTPVPQKEEPLPEQTVAATQETETPTPAPQKEEPTAPAENGADENASPASPDEKPTENTPAAPEKNPADEEPGKEAAAATRRDESKADGSPSDDDAAKVQNRLVMAAAAEQNEPTAEGKNEPLALGLDDAEQNAAEGENGEGSGGTHYVAESGGTQYETVQKILDNMDEGEITLLDSVTEDLTVYAATTIHMNGYSITGNIDAMDNSLTLNGGTVDGTVKVDGGTLSMTAPAEAKAAITGGLNVVSGSASVSGAKVGVKGTLYFDGTDMLISGAVKAVELDSAAKPAAKTLYGSATVNGDTAAEAGFDTDTYKVGGEIAKKLTNKQVGSTTPAAPSLTLTETSKSLTAGKTAVFTANYTGTDTLNAYVQGSAVNGYFTISQKNNGDGTYTVSVKIDEETPGGTYTLFVHELGNTSVQASATITVTGLPDAAEVNGKQYKSLPRALDAAQDGDTVKLLADHVTDKDALNALGDNFTFEQYASIVPVVTKTLTLDLNHKTVDYLEVGFTETNEETQKKETLATGNLTVTGEAAYGRISNLMFMAGALDIRSGEIGGILVDDNGVESPDGGLVCDVNSGTATISNGMVYGLTVLEGASVTVNGGSNHAGAWVVASGATLNITDGTFGDVQFTRNGTIAISGGTFQSIKSYIAEELQPLMSLLDTQKVHAFYKGDDVQDGNATELFDVTVKEHTHTMVNNKCACGFSCTHTNTEGASTIDKDGKCTVCGTRFAAGIGETYYTDVPSALDAATDGQTVKLLANAMLPDGIYVSKTLTLDLDGHSLSGYSLNVGGLTPTSQVRTGKLTVIDSSGGNGAVGVTVRDGGTLVFDPKNDSTTLLQLEVWGGTVELYGGTISRNGLRLNNSITLGNLLPQKAGLAYYRDDTQLTLKEAATQTCDLVVKSCSHGGKNGFDGTNCPYCNAPAVAETALNNGEGNRPWRRFANLQTAIDADRDGGSTLQLLTDVTGDYTIDGTQDTGLNLNGYSIKGTVTVKAAAGSNTTTLSNTVNTTTVSIDKVVAYKGAKLAGSGYPAVIGTLTLAEDATWDTILNNTARDTSLGYKVLNADRTHKWYAQDDVKVSQLNNVIINRLPITSKTLYLKVDGKNQTGSSPKVERGTTVQLCAYCNAKDANVSIYIGEIDGNNEPKYSRNKAEYKKIGTSWYYVVELDANKIGTYDIYFTATKDGYSVTSNSKKLTVTKPNLSNAKITFRNNSNESTYEPYNATTTAPGFTVTYNGKTLKLGVDYTASGTASSAGVSTQRLTIKAVEGSDYTGSKTAEWKIVPHKAKVEVGDVIKAYDGTTDLPDGKISLVSAAGSAGYQAGRPLPLSEGNGFELTDAKYDSANASETEKNISFTVKLTDTNYTFEDGTTEKAFTLKGSETDKTFKIDKAAIASDTQLYQTVFNDLEKTYEIDLKQFLDTILPEGCNYGDIQYGTPSVSMYSDYYPAGGANIENGKLRLSINKAASFKQGKEIGRVTVEVETTNYQPFTLTIHVSVQDKLVPVPAKVNPVSATDIIYGQTLADSELTVNGTMQDRNTLEEVKGTFAWTNKDFKPDASDSYEAEWTFTPAADYEKYATVTGTVTIKVKPAKLTVSVKASSMLYYTGEEQIASIIATGESVDSTPVTFTYSDKVDGNYTSEVPAFTDAGTYTVYYKAEAANHEPATGTFPVTIKPMELLRFVSTPSVTKTYDGTAVAPLSEDAVTFNSRNASNLSLPKGAYSITNARFTMKQTDESYADSPEVGNGKSLSFTVTLTSDNYVFESTTEDSKTIVFDIATDAKDKFTITKAAAPTMQPIELTVINGLAKTYLVNLPALPTLGDNCKYGSIKYEACNFDLIGEGGYANSTATITSNDEFQLNVPAVESQTEGSVGTVGVKITTNNYQDMLLTVEVIAKNKIVPVPDGEITATPIAFGQILRVSTIAGTMKDDGKTVKGTFEWTNPSTQPDKAGDYQAEWTFTPDAPEYATATGTVTIKVNKADPAFIAPTAQENLTYTGQEQALITAGSVKDYGPTMQYSLTEDGTYSQDIPTGTDAGTYTVWYRVFGDPNHNDTDPASVPVSIGKKPLPPPRGTAASKTYDGTTNAGITSVTFDNVTLNRGTDYTVTASFDDAGVGNDKNVTATVTLMGQVAKNYALEQSSFLTTGSITAKQVTVSGITANGKVYDGTTDAVLDYSKVVLDGVLENDTLTVTAKGMFEKADVGEQKVTISDLTLDGNSANNYVLAESGNQTETIATITAKEVTVTPDNKSKVYQEKDPELTYIVSGVLSGETLKGITLARAEGENAGQYAITATADAGANPNYEVTFAKGTLTIEPKSIKGAKVVLGKALTANGAEQTQTVEKVLLDGKELPANSYTVAGNTATAPGRYTLTVTAKGNYTDSVEQIYAIAYKDTAVPSSSTNPSSNNSSNDSENKKNEVAAPTPASASTSKPSTITAMPQTGDTSNPTLYVVLLVASLLGLAVVFVCKKRNDK